VRENSTEKFLSATVTKSKIVRLVQYKIY